MKKARIILAVMMAGALLSGCAGRGGSTSTFSPEQSSVFVTRDGSISSALVETYTNDYYDQGELKASIEKSVADFNTEQGRTAVTLSSCTLGNGKAIALFDYENASDLCTFAAATNDDWTQLEAMEFTTVEKGQSEGKLAGASWKKAKDGSNASTDSVTKKGEYYVVILTGSATIQTEGKIQFYSGNVSLADGYTAVVSGGQAYLVFK